MKMNENNKIGLIMLAITALFFGMYLCIGALPTSTYTEEQEKSFSLDEEHESIKAEIETQTSVILKTTEEYETPIKTEEVSDKKPLSERTASLLRHHHVFPEAGEPLRLNTRSRYCIPSFHS